MSDGCEHDVWAPCDVCARLRHLEAVLERIMREAEDPASAPWVDAMRFGDMAREALGVSWQVDR